MQPRNHTALEIFRGCINCVKGSGENYRACQSNPDNLQNKVPVTSLENIQTWHTAQVQALMNIHVNQQLRSHLEIQKLQNTTQTCT